MARIDKIKQALKNLEPENKIDLNNLVSGEYKNGEDDIYPNDEDFFNTFFSNDPYNAVQRAVYGDYQPMHDYVMFDGYGNLKSLDTYLLERNLISDDEIAEFLDENEQYIEDYLDNLEEEEENEVSEEQYYDALEVLPPFYFDTLNGKKVSGGFAVGEASAHRQTPDGFRATYSGYYKSGGKYFGVGEVYFLFADEDGEPNDQGSGEVEAKTLNPEAFKTGGTTGRKPRLKKSDSVAIYGSRWFDKTYGNTYHTTELYVNDKLIETSDLTYGYDDGYIDTGLKMLEKHFVLPKGYNTSMRWQLRDFVRSYVTRAVDVTRKKDLYAKGGGVRMVNGREYPIGRAWTNDHRHENKSTKWEVPQADRVRKFATGGGLTEKQQRIDLNKNGKLDAEDFAMLRNSMNGAWRNDRKHVNHSQKSEVRYAKKTGSNRTGYNGRKEYKTGGLTPKEPIAFETSNLYFNSFGRDINGNSVIRVSFPNTRAFSIQLNNGSFAKTYKPFGQSGFDDIDEMEINQYVKEYGSPAQKKKLKIYKK